MIYLDAGFLYIFYTLFDVVKTLTVKYKSINFVLKSVDMGKNTENMFIKIKLVKLSWKIMLFYI